MTMIMMMMLWWDIWDYCTEQNKNGGRDGKGFSSISYFVSTGLQMKPYCTSFLSFSVFLRTSNNYRTFFSILDR